MERRFSVPAGTQRQALIVAILLASATAGATPRKKDARVAFDRAVAAYTRGDFQTATALFDKSFRSEVDPDTLFGWAQAERKLGNCEKAIELYDKLLALDIPQQNKDAVKEPLADCKQIVNKAEQDKERERAERDKAERDKAERAERDKAERDKAERDRAERDKAATQQLEHRESAERTEPRDEPAVTPDTSPEDRPWYRDPVGDVLAVTGVIGLGVGGVLLISAHSASASENGAGTYGAAKMFDDQAKSQGQAGVIAASVGGGLFVAGLIWYATHQHERHAAAVTGWIAPGTGGVSIAGGF